MHVVLYALAGLGTRYAGHQQLVVRGVNVPDRGNDGGSHRLGVQRAASSRRADSPASSRAGVASDRLTALPWAAR